MGRIFTKADDFPAIEGKSFNDAVEAATSEAPGITWEELALFNWATKDPREVNRALIESIGCKTIDANNPANTTFDPKFGPGTVLPIRLPKLWSEALSDGKDHVIKIKKRLPAPAVAITKLTRWFVPKKPGKEGTCEIEYSLEGVRERAEKVDFEVHTDHYIENIYDSDGYFTGATQPSDTHADAGSTHIIQDRVCYKLRHRRAPTAPQPYKKWKGESKASKGVLAGDGSTEVYINYQCAPYTVLLRFYKKDSDKDAKIQLKCFCPKWTAPKTKGGAWQLQESSLKASWKVVGDNGKLKAGQLIVWDKDDIEVLRIGLSAGEIQGGACDLASRWDKSTIKRESMPYRIQVQAHSDQDEDDGLAIAVMHTAVKAFQYDKIQFLGFHIQPGTTNTTPKEYLGDADDPDDVNTRCDIMVEAIKAAYGGGVDSSEKVLKLFMGPEFYFRGKRGAYDLQYIPWIMDRLIKETGKFEYADWLFVYGTAIGEIAHEGDGGQTKLYGNSTGDVNTLTAFRKHPCDLTNRTENTDKLKLDTSRPDCNSAFVDRMSKSMNDGVPWQIVEQQVEVDSGTGDERMASTYLGKIVAFDKTTGVVTVDSVGAFSADTSLYLLEPEVWVLSASKGGGTTTIKLRTRYGGRIRTGSEPWFLHQPDGGGGTASAYIKSVSGSGEDWTVIVDGELPYKTGQAIIEEPKASEIVNAALVQKGWPAQYPCKRQLKRAIIDKEQISGLDFINSGGLIEIEGELRVPLTVEGSTGGLGRNENPQGARATWFDPEGRKHIVGSEINVSGEGGSSVITVDDIVFGTEVCLDHGNARLANYYKNSVQPGEPKVQIHLIPSWGMWIGNDHGEPCTVDNGLVFNVDGQRGDSLVRYQDGSTNGCSKHASSSGPVGTPCSYELKGYYCHQCNKWGGNTDCSNGHPAAAPTEFRFCANPTACQGCWPAGATKCPVCSHGNAKTCGQPLKKLGAVRNATSNIPVPNSNSPTHFNSSGTIAIYAVENIPGPEEA
jgi:hypothetical protein